MISLFAAEFEEPEIGISDKWLKTPCQILRISHTLHFVHFDER